MLVAIYNKIRVGASIANQQKSQAGAQGLCYKFVIIPCHILIKVDFKMMKGSWLENLMNEFSVVFVSPGGPSDRHG